MMCNKITNLYIYTHYIISIAYYKVCTTHIKYIRLFYESVKLFSIMGPEIIRCVTFTKSVRVKQHERNIHRNH